MTGSPLPQDLALFEELTIAENVRLPARLGDAAAATDHLKRLLEELGLGALVARLPDEASLGE